MSNIDDTIKQYIKDEVSKIEVDSSTIDGAVSEQVSYYFDYSFDPSDHISDYTVSRATKEWLSSNNDVIEEAVSDAVSDAMASAVDKFFASPAGKSAIINAIKDALNASN